MAKNVDVIVQGLKQFAKAYDTNYDQHMEIDFYALAYQGLFDTSYFKKNVKDKQIDFGGQLVGAYA